MVGEGHARKDLRTYTYAVSRNQDDAMSGIESKQRPLKSRKFEVHRSRSGKSAADTLIELGMALASAELNASPPGWWLCSHCWEQGDPRRSTAQWPNVFCSEGCEQEFICAALTSLTVGDCIRIHGRLQALLMGTQETGLLNVSQEIDE